MACPRLEKPSVSILEPHLFFSLTRLTPLLTPLPPSSPWLARSGGHIATLVASLRPSTFYSSVWYWWVIIQSTQEIRWWVLNKDTVPRPFFIKTISVWPLPPTLLSEASPSSSRSYTNFLNANFGAGANLIFTTDATYESSYLGSPSFNLHLHSTNLPPSPSEGTACGHWARPPRHLILRHHSTPGSWTTEIVTFGAGIRPRERLNRNDHESLTSWLPRRSTKNFLASLPGLSRTKTPCFHPSCSRF